jgi:hypothetical protein
MREMDSDRATMPVPHPQAGAKQLARRDSRGTGGEVSPPSPQTTAAALNLLLTRPALSAANRRLHACRTDQHILDWFRIVSPQQSE